MEIKISLTQNPKEKPQNDSELGFGSLFTDHMFIMDYAEGTGWHDARVVPYQNISISPAAKCLHYGQEVFEGLKAYRTASGEIQLFRPRENFKRLNISNDRLVIPHIDEEFCLKALKKLVEIDKDWVPHSDGASLYIRPFIVATEPYLGVAPSTHYSFMIILSPSGAYYATGLDPVSIYVEDKYVRVPKGGLGSAKTGGNYAASLLGQEEAHKRNCAQVLWLDGVERKYIEEVGSMNIFFKIDGQIVTPQLEDSVLAGITRKSVIEMCKHWGYTVAEKKISIDEVAKAHEDGKLEEVFGTGTAAIISPVGMLKWKEKEMAVNNSKTGEVSQRLYDTLTGMQYGKIADEFNWIEKIG